MGSFYRLHKNEPEWVEFRAGPGGKVFGLGAALVGFWGLWVATNLDSYPQAKDLFEPVMPGWPLKGLLLLTALAGVNAVVNRARIVFNGKDQVMRVSGSGMRGRLKKEIPFPEIEKIVLRGYQGMHNRPSWTLRVVCTGDVHEARAGFLSAQLESGFVVDTSGSRTHLVEDAEAIARVTEKPLEADGPLTDDDE